MAENILNEARWDDNVRQWLATGGPGYSTSIVSVQSGDEQRASNWINARGRYNVGDRNVPMAKYQDLLSFFHRVKGRFYGFRLRDWTDFRDDGRGVLGAGVGTGEMTYQMNKIRTIPNVAGATLQKITRPIGPTFASSLGNTVDIFINGVEVPQGGGQGSCYVDDAGGKVLFVPYTFAVANITTASRIQFTGNHNLIEGDWLTLSGFDGAQEGNNDRMVRVSNIISSNTVDTNGPLIDGSGPGTAANLPGPTDALTWTGLYDIPARFELDDFQNTVEAFIEGGEELTPTNVWIRLGSIPLIQLRE